MNAHRDDSPSRDVPILYRGIADAAKRSRAAAVKLFCLECVGYVRADVTACAAIKCPLYRHRPYQDGDEDACTPANSGDSDAKTRAKATGEGKGADA